MRRITLAATVLAGVTAASAYLVLTAPADAAPACEFGFLTIKKESWILECSKTAPMSQKGVLLTQANNANCKTDSYWNFGPKVTATHLRRNTLVKVNYVCGHAES